MKARLTEISLHLPGRLFEIGEVVERGVDLPEELFDARVQARTAELVGEGLEPSAEVLAAIEAWRAQILVPAETMLAAAVTIPDKRAVVDAYRWLSEEPRFTAVGFALSALMGEVLAADEAELQSLTGGSPVPGEDEAGGDAASDADAGHGPPASAENSSEADAAADTHAPQPNAGTDGKAAEAPASAVEPAAPSTTSAPSKKPARKGAAKGD